MPTSIVNSGPLCSFIIIIKVKANPAGFVRGYPTATAATQGDWYNTVHIRQQDGDSNA